MNKITILFFTFSFTLFGMSYTKFKKHTLEHAPLLKSQALLLEQKKEENKIRLRTENPTLGLELSKFNTDFEANRYGYAVSASQKLRTQSYLEDLEDENQAQLLLSSTYVSNRRASYIKRLEKRYTAYVYQYKRRILLKEEIKLSKTVTAMAKEHYENGSESKVAYLEAKTETLKLQIDIHAIKLLEEEIYYELLAMAGYTKNMILDKKFIYSVTLPKKTSVKLSNKEKILLAQEKLMMRQAKMNERMFESYELTLGIEKEPVESILKFGFSIPLPLNHEKEEEKSLARLKIQQLSLDKQYLKLELSSSKKTLKNSIKKLVSQHKSLQKLYKEQLKINTILIKGYKIAQASLFELMQEKSKLIQTKKSLLDVVKSINERKIELRFLQGEYND